MLTELLKSDSETQAPVQLEHAKRHVIEQQLAILHAGRYGPLCVTLDFKLLLQKLVLEGLLPLHNRHCHALKLRAFALHLVHQIRNLRLLICTPSLSALRTVNIPRFSRELSRRHLLHVLRGWPGRWALHLIAVHLLLRHLLLCVRGGAHATLSGHSLVPCWHAGSPLIILVWRAARHVHARLLVLHGPGNPAVSRGNCC